MAEGMSMEDFDRLISENPPDSVPPEPTEETTTEPASQTEPAEPSQAQAQQSQTEPAQQTQPGKRTANDAFAAMRVQNKTLSNALAAVLRQHGLDPNLANDPNKLIQDAENARLEEEAQRQNVPTELLQRLTQLENRDRENQQKRLADAALLGFQTVKNQFNLSNTELSEFAKQLQDAGTNPFEQEMDLVQQYKLHNLDKIIANETQKAVELALRNQQTSSQYSTTPSKTQGKESTGADAIDTMAKFDRFLMNLK